MTENNTQSIVADKNIIMEKMQHNYLIFDSLDEDESFDTTKFTSRSNIRDKLIYDKLVDWLDLAKVREYNDIIVHDGSKKTFTSTKSDIVLKVYPSNALSLFLKEQDNYDIINRLEISHYFVKQYSWDRLSLTALAIKLDGNQPKYPDSMQKIMDLLVLKGYTMGDLHLGDNIGHYNGTDVIFDIKSLKKLQF